jgi:hypothetical protein
MVKILYTAGFLPIYTISASRIARQSGLQGTLTDLGSFDNSNLDGDNILNFMDNFMSSDEFEDDASDTTLANMNNHQTTSNFNELLTKLGSGGDMPCPILPDLQSGGSDGFLGECEFPSMNETSNFIQVYEDCHGNPLPVDQAWYKSAFNFPGKENAIWYAPSGNHDHPTSDSICKSASMPLGTHMWCPHSELESAWLWHHHPDQPFNPYPTTKGLWTGAQRVKKTDENDINNYYCDTDRYSIPFLNWGADEPSGGKSRFVMMYYMSTQMMDLREAQFGSSICELNCDLLRPCEALNCQPIGAQCTDNGTIENSFCTCDDPELSWDRQNSVCSRPTVTYNIDANNNGMKQILEAVFEDGIDSGSRRKKRDVDAVFDDIMGHGCHCIKMDKDFTGLGGRTTIDTMDGLCQSWTAAKRCLTLQGGSCEGRDLSIDTYQVEINPTTKEMNCTINDTNGSDDCLKDNCYIDTLNVQFILGELSNDPSWTPVTGDSTSCPKCHNCVAPAGCRGTAPNVETVSWLDFNQNGL